jgi:RNA polymerase sigma-70 factor (ECF subfamily)
MTTKDETTHLTRELARDLDRCFDDLVQAYQRPLFAYAYRMMNSAQDAEEVVQDVFIRAYRALSEYEPDRIRSMALSPWLYRICVNQVRNKHRRAQVLTDSLPDEMGMPHEAESTEHGYERQETKDELHALMAYLPPVYRTAILLRFMNDLSYLEMAQVLDQPEGTVKSNVHRGLSRLRTLHESHRLTSPDLVTPISRRKSGGHHITEAK